MASGINPRNGNEEETKNLLNIITEEDHMAKQKPHILMMPYLGQSHANLAKQLASHGVTITFINSQFIHNRTMKRHETVRKVILGPAKGDDDDESHEHVHV